MPHFKTGTGVTERHIRGTTKDTKSIPCLSADQKLSVERNRVVWTERKKYVEGY